MSEWQPFGMLLRRGNEFKFVVIPEEYNPIPQSSPEGTGGIVDTPTPEQARIAQEKKVDYSLEGRLNKVKEEK